MLNAINTVLKFIFISIILCLNADIVNSIPQCLEISGRKEDIVCTNVNNIKDLQGIMHKDWKHLKIINDKKQTLVWEGKNKEFLENHFQLSIFFPTFLEIPLETANLEHLDISQAGGLSLRDKGFENFLNLKALNISNCKLNSLEDTYFSHDNRLENLDASWNLLTEISGGLNIKLKSLEVANFSHNALEEIGFEGFLPEVRILHLDFNNLKSFRLHDSKDLNILTLGDNSIEKVSKNLKY